MPPRRPVARRQRRLRAPAADGAAALSSSERVYRKLKASIVSGQFLPGARLIEQELAGRFGVSRTPVREALKRLVDGNFVLVDPTRAYVVRTADPAEIEDVYLVRELLDGLAARLATRRSGSDDVARLRLVVDTMREALAEHRTDVVVSSNIMFHDQIYAAAGNATLSRIAIELRELIRRFSRDAFESPARVAAVVQEHEALIAAIERGDAAEAERVARDHLRSAREHLSRLYVRRSLGVDGDEALRA